MQNKYDTNVTLEDNSSLTYMLKNIEPGSTVLEFGPATGYMTKHLKEQMNCQVYIVEIDEDAYERASAYAVDGICGSAEDEQWYEKFKDIRFDYITFADVLEHLVNPWQVLKRVTDLLKGDTGKVLVSIPNIGHNAVLVDLINNKFEYRRTGIMDNTHLRFFTHDSVVEMFRESGLYVEDEDAVIFNLEYAGFGNSETDISENVWRELQLREYGFVNQFLFTLGTKSEKEQQKTGAKAAITYECALYYAMDGDYCEEQKVLGSVQMTDNYFCAEFDLAEEVEAKSMMIDVLPFPGIVRNVKLVTDSAIEEIQPINGVLDGNEYYFWGDSVRVQVLYVEPQKLSHVRLCGTIEMIQTRKLGEYIAKLQGQQDEMLVQRDLEIQRLNGAVEEKMQIVHQLGETINEKEQLLMQQAQQLSEQAQQLSEQAQQLSEQAQVIGQKEQQLVEQAQQITEKDAFIEKVKATTWFRMLGKRIMKDK